MKFLVVGPGILEHPTEGMKRESRYMAAQMTTLADTAGVAMPAYRGLAEALTSLTGR